jgi:putative flippase GtrA
VEADISVPETSAEGKPVDKFAAPPPSGDLRSPQTADPEPPQSGRLHRERLLGQVLRFAVVGGLNTLIDYGLYNFFYKVVGLPLLVSNTMSVSIAIVNSFLWNRYWTFGRGDERDWHQQALPFLAISLVGLVINTIGVGVLHAIFGADSLLAINLYKLVASVLSLTWNFVGYRYIVFRPKATGTPV